MRKADVILCLLLAALAAAGFFYIQNNGQGQTVSVSVNGKTVLQKPLAALPQTFTINTQLGSMTLNKTENGIAVASAPCPDKICQKQGAITNSGGSIICVPCRTIITLTDNDHDYDAILN